MSTRAISRLLLSAAVIAPEIDLKCCKRSDLPLYEPESTRTLCACKPTHHGNGGMIEQTIRSIRLNIDSLLTEVRKYEDMTMGYVHEGVDNAQWLVDYLGDEQNQAPKAPAIAIGGLTGLIFGLRGGFFKKIVYATIGTVGMAAVCYPKEAKEYGGMAAEEGYKYATIAYNFAYGVKKGDPPVELPKLPKLPGSFSEVVTMVSDFASSTSASLTDTLTLSDSASDAKKVGTDDPCKWVEMQKDSGAYDRIMNAEADRLLPQCECDEIPERDEATDKPLSYYEGDECCPCHLGSCMHPTDEDSCPAELPYMDPILPDPVPEPCPCDEENPQCDNATAS